MKKQVFTLALSLTLCLTLLAGCEEAASSSSESGGSSAAANTSSQTTTVSSENTPVSSEQAPVLSEQTPVSSTAPELTPENQEARQEYMALLKDWYATSSSANAESFLFKDLDNNGMEEMIFSQEGTNLTIYTFDGKVKRVGNHDFLTGTLRLLSSDDPDCPGIFYFMIGGGLESYGYLTIKDNEITMEKLWDEDFSGTYEDRDKIVEYTDNKLLIEESKKAYQENKDIEFSPLSSVASAESEPYLTADPDKSDAYNAAITAYNDFLCGRTTVKEKDDDSSYNISDLETISGEAGIDRFVLLDVNGDGIPELHAKANSYLVLSYANNAVVEWYSMTGQVKLLENGAILAETASTGTFYDYTTFGADGTTSTKSFDCLENGEESIYNVDNKTVTKEEWDELTKDIFALKEADLDWQDWDGVRS